MKQMETRVNCANTGRRDGMNGGWRERGGRNELTEHERDSGSRDGAKARLGCREGERARERGRTKDIGACLRARKRNRVFLQFNFTGASTREAFTSIRETDLPAASNFTPLPSIFLLETPLRSLKVTRNLAGFPPEFRLNIIRLVDKRRRSLAKESKVKPRRSNYPFLFLFIPSANVTTKVIIFLLLPSRSDHNRKTKQQGGPLFRRRFLWPTVEPSSTWKTLIFCNIIFRLNAHYLSCFKGMLVLYY